MNNVKVFNSILEFQKYRKSLNGTVGFVPTMGALHEGHASLMRKSSMENDFSVLSIYVNSTQFNNPTDLEKYPKTYEADLKMASECGINAVISPNYSEIYADEYRYKLTENKFSKILCGASRSGHYDGVLTIVMKLFNIVQPQKAYFGEKDFQQLKLIEDMVKSFFMPIEVVRCKTLREDSGLAMSSRNKRLTTEGLKKAALIYKSILSKNSAEDVRDQLIKNNFEVDYVTDIDGRRFVAAILESVRLIDNVEI